MFDFINSPRVEQTINWGIVRSQCCICMAYPVYSKRDSGDMVTCVKCSRHFHSNCYGVHWIRKSIQATGNGFQCQSCLNSIKFPTVCELCGNSGGDVRRHRTENVFCHLSCVTMFANIRYTDEKYKSFFHDYNLTSYTKEHYKCIFCQNRPDKNQCKVTLKCYVSACYKRFHITCLLENLNRICEMRYAIPSAEPSSDGFSYIVKRGFKCPDCTFQREGSQYHLVGSFGSEKLNTLGTNGLLLPRHGDPVSYDVSQRLPWSP